MAQIEENANAMPKDPIERNTHYTLSLPVPQLIPVTVTTPPLESSMTIPSPLLASTPLLEYPMFALQKTSPSTSASTISKPCSNKGFCESDDRAMPMGSVMTCPLTEGLWLDDV